MRIPIKSIETYPFYLQPFFWIQKRKYGEVLNSALVWARVPKLFLGLSTLYGMLDRKSSPLEPALRSLLTVRVSQINHCPFCIDINSALLLERGMSKAKLEALSGWKSSKLFNKKERAVLKYLEEMTLSRQRVETATFEALKSYLKDDEIIELTALIAFQNMSSKFNAALDISSQGFCLRPSPKKRGNSPLPRNTKKRKKPL